MLRVGLSGCGAVSRLYYGPALRQLEAEHAVAVTGLFDPDRASVAELAALFPKAQRCASFETLLGAGVDLVIVASPPRFHAPQAMAALEAGVRVHCEKPLALSAAEGARMLAAAQAAGVSLSVGLMRRSFPAVQAIADLLKRGALGPLRSVEVFEGGPFDWPVRSPRYFSLEESGGGVLRDLGPHVLDLLTGWLGELDLRSYRDDAAGGVEANCLVEFACGNVPCAVRLSRDWPRPNRYLVTGEDGWLAWVSYEPGQVEMALNGGAPHVLTLGDLEQASDFLGAFTNGLRDVLAQIDTGAAKITLRSLGLDTLEFIDRCYAARQPMDEPWRLPPEPAS